ncbi:MAG: hypothetical protein EHJ94_10310 [Deltaproteobacteria bacterium]|nr:MAG: hypothetical protein EHJ94_10310 [Deltaproteobacteria bacterium]
MITIKQYANGRYFDEAKKQYIKKEDLAKMLGKKMKIKVVSSKNGKDITKTTLSHLSKPEKPIKKTVTKQNTLKKWMEDNKKWIRDNMDEQINKILSAMNLPTKEQVLKLTSSMDALNDKVSELEKHQARRVKEMERRHIEQIKEMEKIQARKVQQIKKEQALETEELGVSQQTES